MSIFATAATPPPPTPGIGGLPPALPTTTLPSTASGGGLRERIGSIVGGRLPMGAIIGGLLGGGLGFFVGGPIGALIGGAAGALIGARLIGRSPVQS